MLCMRCGVELDKTPYAPDEEGMFRKCTWCGNAMVFTPEEKLIMQCAWCGVLLSSHYAGLHKMMLQGDVSVPDIAFGISHGICTVCKSRYFARRIPKLCLAL